MKYEIRVSIEREVEAPDEEDASNKFFEELEEDNIRENTTTENRLIESMEIKKIN